MDERVLTGGASDFSGMVNERKFAALNRLIMRDLNKFRPSGAYIPYTRDEIKRFLKNPRKFERALRRAVIYIYGASPHFRRLIAYFASLSDLAYVVSPHRIDREDANAKTVKRNYRRVLNAMSAMSARTQFPKILTVCLREDVFYGTLWVTPDNITVQQLPSDYCAISSVEGNVPNVTFDFAYFDTHKDHLDYYPPEFRERYEAFCARRRDMRYQELSAPNSFAVKCNSDILTYAVPPFAGLLRELYDIEDYKELKMTKTALENYAMLVMTLGTDKDGNWSMELEKAKEFWRNLDAVLPEEVGSVLTPMPITKIDFERSNTGDSNTVAEAEQNLFSAAGVSSLLFNNEKASANALLLSIKADQAITFGIVKSIEDVVNRYIQAQSYGKNFKVTFLDCSPFNRKELGDMFLKACQYGLPFISMYAASQGLSQSEMDCMNYLEQDLLGLVSRFEPLRSSATQSAEERSAGAPLKDAEELSESGEQNREDA